MRALALQGIHVHAPAAFMPPEPFAFDMGMSVAQIAERQHFHLPYFAILNEEWLPRPEWDRVVGANDNLAFVTLPAGGDSGKDVLRGVLQIAIVAVAVYFAGPAGLGLTGYGLAAARIGAYVVAGYLSSVIIPPQTATSSASGITNLGDVSPTYSLTAQGNQARLDQPEPCLYGYHKITPDFAAATYTEYRDNDLWLYQLFSLGVGQSEVEEIGIEQTPVWTLADGYTGNFSDVEIEIVPPGQPVTLFPANVISSIEVSGQILLGTNEEDAGWVGPFPACPAGKTVNRIATDFVWQQGQFRISDVGTVESVVTSLRVEARLIDDYGDPLDDWIELSDQDYSFAKREQQRVTVSSNVLTGRWEVRALRTNDAGTDDQTYDEVIWQGMRGYVPSTNTFARITALAVAMRATNQLSSTTARRFYTRQTRMLPVYNAETETWSAPVATRKISAAAADILRNDVYGWGRADSEIDLERLASLETTWTARGESFDGVFDQRSNVWAALNDVLHVGRSYAVQVGGTVSFVRDEQRSVKRLMLTPRNIKRGSFGIDFAHYDKDTPDDAIIRYFDERVWSWRSVRCTLPGSTSLNPVTKTVFGITDRTRAWRYGMHLIADNKYRRVFPSATTELEGRFVKRGDLVQVSHPLVEWGRSADVVAFDAATRRLTLSTPALLDADADTYLALKMPDGGGWGPVLVTSGASDYELIADEDDLAAAIIDGGDWADFIVPLNGDMEPTVAVWGAADTFLKDCLLTGARSAGDDAMTLELVVDDPRVYSADEGEPPEEAEIETPPATPASPNVAGLHVEVGGTRFAPELTVTISRSPGAESYIYELSYDHLSWQTLQTGDLTSWQGPVEATTVWIRVTAVGATRGTASEWAGNLTATEIMPAQLSGLSVQAFFKTAWINVSYPDEDGIEGMIASLSATSGFDPETEGTIVYDGDALKRITIDISAAPTVYVRVAAYNRFGKTNLNWSSELEVTAATVGTGVLSTELLEAITQITVNQTAITNEATTRSDADTALATAITTVSGVADGAAAAIVEEVTARVDGDSANATAITTLQAAVDDNISSIETTNEVVAGQGARVAVKLDVNGYVVGTEFVNGDPGGSTFTLLVDNFKVVKPGFNDDAPFPMFTVDETGVRLNDLVAASVTAEEVIAAIVSAGRIESLIVSSPLGVGETIDDARLVIDTQLPYILMRKPVA